MRICPHNDQSHWSAFLCNHCYQAKYERKKSSECIETELNKAPRVNYLNQRQEGMASGSAKSSCYHHQISQIIHKCSHKPQFINNVSKIHLKIDFGSKRIKK